jgi:hypothetical protein
MRNEAYVSLYCCWSTLAFQNYLFQDYEGHSVYVKTIFVNLCACGSVEVCVCCFTFICYSSKLWTIFCQIICVFLCTIQGIKPLLCFDKCPLCFRNVFVTYPLRIRLRWLPLPYSFLEFSFSVPVRHAETKMIKPVSIRFQPYGQLRPNGVVEEGSSEGTLDGAGAGAAAQQSGGYGRRAD